MRFVVVALVVGLAAWGYLAKGLNFGLDLAGGASLAYRAHPPEGQTQLEDEAVKRLIQVLDSRLNAVGVADIGITATQADEIIVELPGRTSDQLDAIKQLIERNGELQFRIRAPIEIETEERRKRGSSGKYYKTGDGYAWVPTTQKAQLEQGAPPEILVLTPEKPLEKELERLERQGAPPEQIREKELELAEVRLTEVFTGEQLAKTAVQNQVAELVVYFEFKPETKPYFAGFTERNIKQPMAIILDGEAASWPTINSTLPGEGIISGGGSGFTRPEAEDLTVVLESGSTGARLELEREENIGPSLGEAAIETGQVSILAGFVGVLLLMLWFYRVPGMVANLALLLNVVIMMGVMAFFEASLTLPGIAGIVLTLGMAVDANILIFERLREERLRGKSLQESLSAGYDRAFVAIVDANVTTVLTALVLIGIGTGAVKGFGVTLTVGILASMFTAIYVTRTVFEWLIGAGIMKGFKFDRDRQTPKLDYVKARRFFTGPTIALMVIGFAFFIQRDERDSKDLEFIGGQEVFIQLKEELEPARAEDMVRADDRYADASVISLSPGGVELDERDDTTNRFRIRVKAEDQEEGDAFIAYLEEKFDGLLFDAGLTDVTIGEADSAGAPRNASLMLHVLAAQDSPDAIQSALTAVPALSEVQVQPGDDPTRDFGVQFTTTLSDPAGLQDTVVRGLAAAEPPIRLSDPMPSISFLNASRAEELWRSAMQAVLLALMFQIVYIRLRFADYKHGFAAVCALIHDVSIALGMVALFDASGLVQAKISLVLVAAFLTLIGYSMNDTIVVFDRIRENLGRRKVVLSDIVNQSVNQTLTRSIRTSITTFIVVLFQFVLNYQSGSVLEGFAFVMMVGVVMGTYSSIFIASPLLLFLPHFWRHFSARPKLAAAEVAFSIVGIFVALGAEGHGVQMWIGAAFALVPVVHFLSQFIPWLTHENPDELLQPEIDAQDEARPVEKPAI